MRTELEHRDGQWVTLRYHDYGAAARSAAAARRKGWECHYRDGDEIALVYVPSTRREIWAHLSDLTGCLDPDPLLSADTLLDYMPLDDAIALLRKVSVIRGDKPASPAEQDTAPVVLQIALEPPPAPEPPQVEQHHA